jgi:predicted Zn-dependent peptidase
MSSSEPVSRTLSNGLRIVCLPFASEVVYCGYAINAGTRDELPAEAGMAHFVEHLLFKGTAHRRAWHILNRMERVGGELNAVTNKEDTVVHCTCLREDFVRAVDLLTDIVFHSTFPAHEIERERGVVLDEIQSYLDSPSDLIFDDFEEQVFHAHPLGRNILGRRIAADLTADKEEERILTYSSEDLQAFAHRHYRPENMVFFVLGDVPLGRIERVLQGRIHTESAPPIGRLSVATRHRRPFEEYAPQHVERHRGTNQAHVIVGAPAGGVLLSAERRMSLALLNDLLGGAGMNSRLNVALRERRGLVYSVDSNLSVYTDALLFTIYFGTDAGRVSACRRLVEEELRRVIDEPLSAAGLAALQRQAIGQVTIAEAEVGESTAIALGRSVLHDRPYHTLPRIVERIRAVTALDLQEAAAELLNAERLSSLCYI